MSFAHILKLPVQFSDPSFFVQMTRYRHCILYVNKNTGLILHYVHRNGWNACPIF